MLQAAWHICHVHGHRLDTTFPAAPCWLWHTLLVSTWPQPRCSWGQKKQINSSHDSLPAAYTKIFYNSGPLLKSSHSMRHLHVSCDYVCDHRLVLVTEDPNAPCWKSAQRGQEVWHLHREPYRRDRCCWDVLVCYVVDSILFNDHLGTWGHIQMSDSVGDLYHLQHHATYWLQWRTRRHIKASTSSSHLQSAGRCIKASVYTFL